MPNTAGAIVRNMVNSPFFFKEGMLDEANAEYSRGDNFAQHDQPCRSEFAILSVARTHWFKCLAKRHLNPQIKRRTLSGKYIPIAK